MLSWLCPDPSETKYANYLHGIIAVLLLIICSFNWKPRKVASLEPKDSKTFESVIGLSSVKSELKLYISLIANPKKHEEWDVRLPKGILLVGPPGTGKTHLVRELAKMLDIDLIAASGSEFIEKYVGVGAARIRKLFAKARAKDKCIIFIDEIEAIGRSRALADNSERSSTLNQLLIEMDGYNKDDCIIVIAATNLVADMDPALLRSGRFDKKIYFDPPNQEERVALYTLFLDGKKCSKLNISELSRRSAGLTGADIENIVNQAKIRCIQDGKASPVISEPELQEALDEVMIGRQKIERTLTDGELERVAFHEAGHAIMSFILKFGSSPLKVSIIPRGEHALGFSQSFPDDKKLFTKQEILSRIAILLGGRCGEITQYDVVSTGAGDDIAKLTALANSYREKWGMDACAPIDTLNLGVSGILVKESVASMQCLITKIEEFVLQTLAERKAIFSALARRLLVAKTMYSDDIRAILGKDNENILVVSIS